MDIVLATSLSFCFVGAFYLWPTERRFARLTLTALHEAACADHLRVDRDAPATIKRRVLTMIALSVASATYLGKVDPRRGCTDRAMGRYDDVPFDEFTHWTFTIIRCTLSTALLFTGPLVENGLQPTLRRLRHESWLQASRTLFLAPIGEELFFRGVLTHVLRCRTPASRILLTATLFSLSHAHHVFTAVAENYRLVCVMLSGEADTLSKKKCRLRCWRSAVVDTSMLCACTFVFGLLSGVYFLYVSDRSVCAAAAAHILCNLLGCPSFTFLTRDTMRLANRAWYAVMYVLGVVLWSLLCFSSPKDKSPFLH